MELSFMELIQASVSAGTVTTKEADRIERRKPNVEAEARPVALEHRRKVAEEQSKSKQAWGLPPVRPPPPLPMPSDSKDVEMIPVDSSAAAASPSPAPSTPVSSFPPIGTKRLVLSDCADASAKSRCSHEVIVETYLGGGQKKRESYGYVAGYYVAATADKLELKIPAAWQAHIAEQERANVDRLQQPYHKPERKTRPGSKRKRTSASGQAAIAKSDTYRGTNIFGQASIKPEKHKSNTSLGGRRAGNSTSKKRLKTFVRVLLEFPLMRRNSVHKGTTAHIADMYAMRDRGVGAYHQLTFPAVQFRTPDPHGTVSTMKSGELGVASAPSEDDALILAFQQVFLATLLFGTPAILENFGAVNITASAGLGWAIDLDKLAAFVEQHPLYKTITYDRSVFPGLHWVLTEPVGVVLGFFQLGFVNAVGLKEDSHFKFVRDRILPELNANRARLENKERTRSAVPVTNSTDDKTYERLCEHADSTMNKETDELTGLFETMTV